MVFQSAWILNLHICIKKRTILPLSSIEAEYVAMYEASKIIMWLRQFFHELGYPPSTSTILYEDNKSAIQIVHNGNDKSRTKHMDVRCHIIRELVKSISLLFNINQLKIWLPIFDQTSWPKIIESSATSYIRPLSFEGGGWLSVYFSYINYIQTKLSLKISSWIFMLHIFWIFIYKL